MVFLKRVSEILSTMAAVSVMYFIRVSVFHNICYTIEIIQIIDGFLE